MHKPFARILSQNSIYHNLLLSFREPAGSTSKIGGCWSRGRWHENISENSNTERYESLDCLSKEYLLEEEIFKIQPRLERASASQICLLHQTCEVSRKQENLPAHRWELRRSRKILDALTARRVYRNTRGRELSTQSLASVRKGRQLHPLPE